MTVQEFTDRTSFRPSMDCFNYFINEEYMDSEIQDKDEWCKQWKKKGGIQRAFDWVANQEAKTQKELDVKCETVGRMLSENNKLKEKVASLSENWDSALNDYRESRKEVEVFIEQNTEIADVLIGKSHAYDDTDFRDLAIKMIGEKQVVLRTLAMGLPLFDEDKEYLSNNLK